MNTLFHFSIQKKILLLIFIALAIFGCVSARLSYQYYLDATIEQHKRLGVSTSALVASVIDADRVENFIKNGEKASGYMNTKRQLEIIRDSSPNIEYVYVYKILRDGCHVVFDLDTDETAAGKPGEVVAFDEAFDPYLPTLLKGGKIDPVISDDKFGWLLTVYTPVYDNDGVCQCYAAVDISMEHLRDDTERYYRWLGKVFSGILVVVLLLAAIMAHRIITPINSMAKTTDGFVFDDEKALVKNLEKIRSLNIRTGDEVENLYRAFVKMTNDSVQYVTDINHKNETIRKMHDAFLITLADMVENRDQNTGDHIRKTASYVEIILNELKREGVYQEQLTDKYIQNVVSSAPLHDVGKINVSDVILNKPGKLTDEEFEIMKTHTTAGGNIITSLIDKVPDSDYLYEAKNLAMYHHEKWNGKGYPSGLAGEDIPLSARVMAVADVFDALISNRCYKKGFPYDKALGIIREERGRQFDPKIVDAFFAAEDQILEVADKFSEKEKQNATL
jgi:response regulator RpfG family c-di-GMP phosphodiesterase